MDKYIEQHSISCYRSDSHWVMRPEAFLDMAQQIAVKGAQQLSFNDEALKALGCVWVLARDSAGLISCVTTASSVMERKL